MMLPYIKRIVPHMENRKGYAGMFIITIVESHKDDAGLIAHELEHVKQWYALTALWLLMCGAIYFAGYQSAAVILTPFSVSLQGLLNRFVSKAREKMEVFAYRAQMEQYKTFPNEYFKDRSQMEHLFAQFLSERYDLNMTIYEARKAILK